MSIPLGQAQWANLQYHNPHIPHGQISNTLDGKAHMQGQHDWDNEQGHYARQASDMYYAQHGGPTNQYNGQMRTIDLGYGYNNGQYCSGNTYGNIIQAMSTDNSEGMKILWRNCIGQGGWDYRQTNHCGISQTEGNTFPYGQYSIPAWETSGICNAQNGYVANQFGMHTHNLGYVENAGQHGNRNAYGNDIKMEHYYAYGNDINTMSTENGNSEGMIISQNCIGQGGRGDRPANYSGASQNDGNESNRYRGTNTPGHAYAKNQTCNGGNLANGMTEIHPTEIITATSSSSAQGHTYEGVWYPSKEQCGRSCTDQHPQPSRREPKILVLQQSSEEAPQDQEAQINRTTRQEAADLIKKIPDCLDENKVHAKGQECPDTVKPMGATITFKNTSLAVRTTFIRKDGSSYVASRNSLHLSRERRRWQGRQELAQEIIVDILDTVLNMLENGPQHWSKDTTRPWSKEKKKMLSKTNTIKTPWGRQKGPLEDSSKSSQCDPLPKKRGIPTLETIQPVKESAIHGGETLGATDLGPTRPSKASKMLQSNAKPIIGKGIVTTDITADTRENQSGEIIEPVGETLRIIEQEQVVVVIDTYWTDQNELSQGPQSPMVPMVGKGSDRTTTHIESHTDQPGGDLKVDKL
jgi:hypothetical protein